MMLVHKKRLNCSSYTIHLHRNHQSTHHITNRPTNMGMWAYSGFWQCVQAARQSQLLCNLLNVLLSPDRAVMSLLHSSKKSTKDTSSGMNGSGAIIHAQPFFMSILYEQFCSTAAFYDTYLTIKTGFMMCM